MRCLYAALFWALLFLILFFFTFLGLLVYYLTCVTGAIELDLHHLINPSKTPEKCDLSMVPDGTTHPKSDQFKSLFDQKSVRGWWPCYMDKDGKRELGVSTANAMSFVFFFFMCSCMVQYDIHFPWSSQIPMDIKSSSLLSTRFVLLQCSICSM